MLKQIVTTIFLFTAVAAFSQGPVGKWKKVSHIIEYGGQKSDSYKALLVQRPCAAKIVYEINADGSYRLKASASGCDEKYSTVQEKLYANTNWKVAGNKITISSGKNFTVGQTYTFSIKGNTMTWTGTEGQGIITWQKL